MRTAKHCLKHSSWAMFCALSLSVLSGCDVHEFPGLPTEANVTLHLEFDTDMPLHTEMTNTMSRAVNSAYSYDARHVVSIHRLYDDGDYDRTADTFIVFTCDDVENLDCTKELTLPEGQYAFFVWTDFVDEGSQSDKFYATSDFTEIILNDAQNYTGSCDYRDAFRGMQQASVTAKKDEITMVKNDVTVTMERPLAKFKFVSTDYDEFIENALMAEAQKNANKASGHNGNDAEARSVNPEDYRVVFRYTEFMPCSYNMFTDKPADSWSGVSFEGALNPIGNQEVELGFDHVFVNGSESCVSVMLEIHHKDGTLVASSPAIHVPLKRSKLTIVRGNFLTSIASGGVSIVPDFDGEYNIEIK